LGKITRNKNISRSFEITGMDLPFPILLAKTMG
jgi:hypothetical protein